MKFSCPNCRAVLQNDDPRVGAVELPCPECGFKFRPGAVEDRAKRVSNIKSGAHIFAVFAAIIFVGGVFCIFAGNFTAFAGCTGVAIGLYMVSQITHIRANTER